MATTYFYVKADNPDTRRAVIEESQNFYITTDDGFSDSGYIAYKKTECVLIDKDGTVL